MREEFKKVPLGELAELRMGGTPSRAEPTFWADGDSGRAWIAISDMKEKFLSHTNETVTTQGARAARLQAVDPGTPVMSFKLSVGRATIPTIHAYTNEAIVALIPIHNRANSRWLYYAAPRITKNAVTETAVKGKTLNLSKLVKLEIPTPDDVREQRRIAEILDTLDELHESTITRINKLQAIETAIREYFMRKAASAETRTLAEVSLGRGEYGSNSPAIAYDEKLPRYVRITDIDETGNLHPSDKVSLPRPGSRRYVLNNGDLLIARTGFTTGKSYLYRAADGECAFAGYLVRFKIDTSVMVPEFAYCWTKSHAFARWVNQHLHEVGQRNISAPEYATHRLPVPHISEQIAIVQKIQSASNVVQVEQTRRGRLELLKQGLMEDLLTGRVRVSEAEAVLENL